MTGILKVGVMGCASIAGRMVIPAIIASPYLQLIAVSSRDEYKAKEFASKYECEYEVGYEALINRKDIDMIYMPLPTGLHKEWAIKALGQGKHLIIEKSLAANFKDAQDIVNVAKRNRLLVKENFMFEYHRQFAYIQDVIAKGALGEIRCVRSSFGFPPFKDKDNIRYSKQLEGGALLDAGAYTLKIANLLLGENLQVTGAVLNESVDFGVDISGGIMLNDDKGCIVETAFGFDHFYQCELEVWGSKGKLTANRIFTAGPGVKPTIIIENESGMETLEIEEDNHFLNLLNSACETVSSGNFEAEYNAVLSQSALLAEVKEKAVTLVISA